MDDWMVIDCGNIIVNVMDSGALLANVLSFPQNQPLPLHPLFILTAEAREVFALESFYEEMKLGEDPYAGMSYDEWLAKNPVHPKWIARLQRDEEELDSKQRRR